MLAAKLIAFIESVGLTVRRSDHTDGVLPGLMIEDGALVVHEAALRYPGDLLHEAGHLAVIPADERRGISDAEIAKREHAPAEEMAATAWSYAACVHLGLDGSVVFHEAFKGGSHLAESFAKGQTFGVPILQWVGLTTIADYPKMNTWIRD